MSDPIAVTINTPSTILGTLNTNQVAAAFGSLTGIPTDNAPLAGLLTGAYVSVKNYGAVGDGVTDDSKAIALALGAALASKRDLFFPAGTYYVNSFWNTDGTPNTTSSVFFQVPASSTWGNPTGYTKIRFFGEYSKITSSLITNTAAGSPAYLTYFQVPYNSQDCSFFGLSFESTHAITTNYITGIQYSAGSAGNVILTPKVIGCKFEGLTPSIQLNGTVNAIIRDNIFNAPAGRQQAPNNTQPACFVMLSTNDNAQVVDPIIENNYANGFTGASITATTQRQLMDNFIQGDCTGGLIRGNITQNFGTEHIAIGGYRGTAVSDAPLFVTGNKFYCNIPNGTYKYQSVTALTYCTGYRGEKLNTVVQDNVFHGVTQGILMYGAGVSYQYKNWTVKGNQFYMNSDSTNTATIIQNAVQLQGENNALYKLLNGIVSDNTVVIDTSTLRADVSLFQINDATNFILRDNMVNVRNVTKGGFNLYYLGASRSTGNMVRNLSSDDTQFTAITNLSSSTVTRADLVLTTTGTSGAATMTGNALNIPQYSGGGGGRSLSINSISTSQTAGSTANTDYVYLVSGTTTLTLPTAVSNTCSYKVKRVGTGLVTINTTSAQTIDGSTSVTLPVQYTALDIVGDNANWNII